MNDISKHSGNKYVRPIIPAGEEKTIVTSTGVEVMFVDVYCVLQAFGVNCPAVQHAVKKLLCAGLRDKGTAAQDLREARDAISRAIKIQEDKDKINEAVEERRKKREESMARIKEVFSPAPEPLRCSSLELPRHYGTKLTKEILDELKPTTAEQIQESAEKFSPEKWNPEEQKTFQDAADIMAYQDSLRKKEEENDSQDVPSD